MGRSNLPDYGASLEENPKTTKNKKTIKDWHAGKIALLWLCSVFVWASVPWAGGYPYWHPFVWFCGLIILLILVPITWIWLSGQE